MEQKKTRKLRMYVPRQPLVNQRPWSVVGWLLAFVILLLIIYSYFAVSKNA
jgi:uncharacterized membrane protein YbhN (UPF0104 family)